MDHPLSLSSSLVLGLMLLGCSVAFAQAPAQTAQPLFMREGRINTVDLIEGIITINDLHYSLSPAVHVYTYDRSIKDPQALRADSRLKDARALRAGLRIGYTVEGEGGGKRGALTEAWILPPESRPELGRGGTSAESSATKATGKAQRTQPSK